MCSCVFPCNPGCKCICHLERKTRSLMSKLRSLLNQESRENESGTPDWILAQFMIANLVAYETAIGQRARFYDEPANKLPEVLELEEAGLVKTVPLKINGRVIGEADVFRDGRISAVVHEDISPGIFTEILPGVSLYQHNDPVTPDAET